MKAIAMIPKQKGAASLRDVEMPTPSEEQVLVKVLQAGVCRTDIEIYEGLYGETPNGDDYLILGHECLGRVEEPGKSKFSKDDLVARIVRRSCSDMCLNCKMGEVDMCSTGNYVETGIKGIHGDMTEYFADSPEYLVKIPGNLANVGVLMEPMSVAEKAIRQSFEVQNRLYWNPKKALVFGAGPIGLLTAMALRERHIDTYVAAWSKPGNLKSQIVSKIGAKYISVQETTIKDRFDMIIEASGSVESVANALQLLKPNGVLCLTSVTGGNKEITLPLEKINIDFVLNNKALVGIVNANIIDYRNGIADMGLFEINWPGLTEQLITRRLKPEQYLEALVKKPEDIKVVIEF